MAEAAPLLGCRQREVLRLSSPDPLGSLLPCLPSNPKPPPGFRFSNRPHIALPARPRYKTVVRSINSGVLLVRPCAKTEAHMLALLLRQPKLRFTHAIAEQDFLAWCALRCAGLRCECTCAV